jgi:hypothetical protein
MPEGRRHRLTAWCARSCTRETNRAARSGRRKGLPCMPLPQRRPFGAEPPTVNSFPGLARRCGRETNFRARSHSPERTWEHSFLHLSHTPRILRVARDETLPLTASRTPSQGSRANEPHQVHLEERTCPLRVRLKFGGPWCCDRRWILIWSAARIVAFVFFSRQTIQSGDAHRTPNRNPPRPKRAPWIPPPLASRTRPLRVWLKKGGSQVGCGRPSALPRSGCISKTGVAQRTPGSGRTRKVCLPRRGCIASRFCNPSGVDKG